MIRLVRVELLKLRTTRLWIVMLAVGVGLVALIVIAVLASKPGTDPDARALHDLTTVADVRMLLDIGGIAGELALVVGVSMATSEYRYATAGVQYLATPRRSRVITAKMLAAVPVGALFGLIGACVPLLIALAWFATEGRSVPLDGSNSSSRSRPAPVPGPVRRGDGGRGRRGDPQPGGGHRRLLVWVTVVENLVSSLIPGTAKWFPFNGAAGSFSSQASDRLFARPEAGLLMAAYVVLGWAAAV